MKTKNKTHKSFLIFGLLTLVIILMLAVFYKTKSFVVVTKPVNTMLMLIEFEKIDGILQWEKELDKRDVTALIKAQGNIPKENPIVFKRLADKGYEIAGGYDGKPFWDMPYDKQYELMKESKDSIESITGKKMKVFGSRYFAYDETTLKVADALDIEYILGRGTQDVEAVVYQPKEYKAKVISVTNVDVGEPMGRGSLCDYSLWARGADAKEFGVLVNESINKKPTNMILVSHAYLGGTRLEWWQEYEKVLASNKVKWNGFDSWMKNQKIIKLANAEIPINREVKYVTPNPAKAMEDYEPIPGIEKNKTVIPTTSELMMCQ
jgi:hypothetical protein